MSSGDGIVFYSPTHEFRGTEKCQKFTAIGRIIGESAYPFQMFEDFTPYRRDTEYLECTEVAIHPLLDQLELTAGKKNWGYRFRLGYFELSPNDFVIIGQRMMPEQVLAAKFDL